MTIGAVARIPKTALRPEDMVSIEEALTMEGPEGDFGFGDASASKEVKFFEVDETHYLVPRQWALFRYGDKLPRTYTLEDGVPAKLTFQGQFRPGQREFIDKLIKGLEQNGLGGIGKAKPGFGKTVCAAELIARLGRAAIVIVPRKILVSQWVRRMEQYLGITPGVVLLEKNLCEWDGKPVVIALANSLAARDYGENFYRHFGVVIADEVHRGASPTWWRAIKAFPARYRVGLTATPRRGDGMFRAIQWQVGEIVSVGEAPAMPVKVEIATWRKTIPYRKYFWKRRPVMAKFWKHVSRSDGYAEWLCETAVIPYLLEGRQVLVLSDLRELLVRMHDYVASEIEFPPKAKFKGTGYLVGSSYKKKGMKKVTSLTEEEAQKVACLFGTWIFVSEGFDVATMSGLVMATARADVEQAIGRLQRPIDGKPVPVVFDPRFRASWAIERYEDKRDDFYDEQKFSVRDIT